MQISHWTVVKAGSQRVEVVGLSNKRQITALLGCTIFCQCNSSVNGGQMCVMLESTSLKTGPLHAHPPNHWSNEDNGRIHRRSFSSLCLQKEEGVELTT